MERRSVIFLILVCLSRIAMAGGDMNFKSASTVEETRYQLERLKQDDIWWVVNGKDMAWNFKNLHRIFPTVNVYREG
jgi:hypothetical protein